MLRKLILVCLFVGIVGVAQESSAVKLSRNNPYRSFNISGYNYGSVQWEKSHRKSGKLWSTTRGRRLFRR